MKPLLAILLFAIFSLSTPALAQPAPVSATDSFYDTVKPTIDKGVVTNVTKNGFIPCSGTQCSHCDLVVLFNTLLKWFMTIAFLVFAILAMKAGVGLVVSGSAGSLEAAKKSFTNAFIGLIIILAAWLIVDTLMRGVLKGGNLDGVYSGYGPWSAVQCVSQADVYSQAGFFEGDPASDPAAPPPPSTNPGGAPFTPANSCTGGSCVPLTIPCAASGCNISSGMAPRLAAMHSQAGVAGARATEAMPPSRVHKSQCHNNGTCIDYSKAGGMSAAEVTSVISAANANGLRPVYEVKTQAEKTALVASGAPAANIKVLGNWISAPHFSIYGY